MRTFAANLSKLWKEFSWKKFWAYSEMMSFKHSSFCTKFLILLNCSSNQGLNSLTNLSNLFRWSKGNKEFHGNFKKNSNIATKWISDDVISERPHGKSEFPQFKLFLRQCKRSRLWASSQTEIVASGVSSKCCQHTRPAALRYAFVKSDIYDFLSSTQWKLHTRCWHKSFIAQLIDQQKKLH